MTIEIINGDLLDAFDNGDVDVIAHCCNPFKTFGAGIALQIKKRYPSVYSADELHFDLQSESSISTAYIEGRWVFNLYGQKGIDRYKRQLNYGMFANALSEMRTYLEGHLPDNVVIGFPYGIGCGLAGGDWEIVSEMIEHIFKDFNVKVYKL